MKTLVFFTNIPWFTILDNAVSYVLAPREASVEKVTYIYRIDNRPIADRGRIPSVGKGELLGQPIFQSFWMRGRGTRTGKLTHLKTPTISILVSMSPTPPQCTVPTSLPLPSFLWLWVNYRSSQGLSTLQGVLLVLSRCFINIIFFFPRVSTITTSTVLALAPFVNMNRNNFLSRSEIATQRATSPRLQGLERGEP